MFAKKRSDDNENEQEEGGIVPTTFNLPLLVWESFV
jgi:hypothetical protein